VYLNGNEIYRTGNMPSGTISYTTLATATGENDIDTATISATNLVNGTNIVAVEIHQQALTSSDLSFDFALIGNPAVPQPLRLGIFDGRLALGWTDGRYVIEQADSVTGPWAQVDSPTPLIVSPVTGQKFYRLRK
jgi:hypothetical protein